MSSTPLMSPLVSSCPLSVWDKSDCEFYSSSLGNDTPQGFGIIQLISKTLFTPTNKQYKSQTHTYTQWVCTHPHTVALSYTTRSYPDHITALIIFNHNMACTVTVELQVKQISSLINRLPRTPLQTQILENKQHCSLACLNHQTRQCPALPRRDVIHLKCSGGLGWKRARRLHASHKHKQDHTVHMSTAVKTQNKKGCDGGQNEREQEDVKRMWLEIRTNTWTDVCSRR